MDQFPVMMKWLKEFNYPNIHGMDDAQITDVFSKINRQFLTSWILKQIDDDYCDIVEIASKEDLANLIYHGGFCNALEKGQFVNGECESSKQLIILYKMFRHLKCVSDSKKFEADSKTVSFKEVEDRLGCDTNLFPTYGPKQTLTIEERAKKFTNYRKEIEDLRNAIESEVEAKHITDPTLQRQLIPTMRSLEINFPDFTRKNLDMMKNRDIVGTNKGVFSEQFEETLETCNKNIKTMLEFITSMDVVMKFKEKNLRVENMEYNNKNNLMIPELAELCNAVAALKKDNNF